MTRSTGRVLVVGVVLLAALAWWLRDVPRATPVADVVHPAPAPSRDANHQRRAVRAMPIANFAADTTAREAIAQDLRIVDRIERAIAERGKDDPVVSDMAFLAIMSCGAYRGVAANKMQGMPLALVRGDRKRAWAFDYLEQACEGFDVEAHARGYQMPGADLAVAMQHYDEATAIALARDDLRHAESGIQLVTALSYLERRGKSPLRSTYRSPDGMSKALVTELTISQIRCGALDMCGTHNVLIAGACLADGCLPGTTIEQYWRSQMSSREIEAAMRLRRELEAFRASAP